MALTDNLVSYWKLDESSDGSGAVTRNDSVTTNNLTDNSPYAASAAAKISNGVHLVAANSEYLSIADASQTGLDGSNTMSFSFWTQFHTMIDNTVYALSKWKTDGNQREYAVTLSEGANPFSDMKVNFSVSSDGTTTVTEYSQFSTNASVIASTTAWYHIVITYDNSTETAIFYIDGSSSASSRTDGTSIGANVFSGTAPFQIGARFTTVPAGFYDGIVDELGIWSRVLTSTEVTSLYNGGAGLTYPFTSGPANIKSVGGILTASAKTVSGVAMASIKSISGIN